MVGREEENILLVEPQDNTKTSGPESLIYVYIYIGGFPKIRGYLIGGPSNKDYSILGSILGSPHFGKLPYTCTYIHSLCSLLSTSKMKGGLGLRAHSIGRRSHGARSFQRLDAVGFFLIWGWTVGFRVQGLGGPP